MVYNIYFLTDGDVDAKRIVVVEHFALCYFTSWADCYHDHSISFIAT
jgi:hypothetical protein